HLGPLGVARRFLAWPGDRICRPVASQLRAAVQGDSAGSFCVEAAAPRQRWHQTSDEATPGDGTSFLRRPGRARDPRLRAAGARLAQGSWPWRVTQSSPPRPSWTTSQKVTGPDAGGSGGDQVLSSGNTSPVRLLIPPLTGLLNLPSVVK